MSRLLGLVAAARNAVYSSSSIAWPRSFAQSAPALAPSDSIELASSAVEHLKELQAQAPDEEVILRVSVEAGGCSGFQYTFDLASGRQPDDLLVESDGAQLVCDSVSLEFLRGATVQYKEDLIRAGFEVADNPNSDASCGCGASFVAK